MGTFTFMHHDDIDAPASEVWEVVADYRRDPEWRTGCRDDGSRPGRARPPRDDDAGGAAHRRAHDAQRGAGPRGRARHPLRLADSHPPAHGRRARAR